MQKFSIAALGLALGACTASLPANRRNFAREIAAIGMDKDAIYTASIEWITGYADLHNHKALFREKKSGKLIYAAENREDITSLKRESVSFTIDITAYGGGAHFELNNPRTDGLNFWTEWKESRAVMYPDEIEAFNAMGNRMADSYEKYLNSKAERAKEPR